MKSTNIIDVTNRANKFAAEYTRADGEIWGLTARLQTPITPKGRRQLLRGVQEVLNRLGQTRDAQVAGLVKLSYARGVHLVEPDEKIAETVDAVEIFIKSLRTRLLNAEINVSMNLQDATRRLALTSAVTAMEQHSGHRHVGLSDLLAPTGYTDRSGSKWSLGRYANMAILTVAHEVLSEATISTMREHGLTAVKVSSEKHFSATCAPFDGHVFSLAPDDSYPRLKILPPFHPECNHYIYPYRA